MLFEHIGAEWAREVAQSDQKLDPSLENAVQAVLSAHPSEFAATAERFSAELFQAESALLARASAAINSSRDTEAIGRALVSIAHFSGEAGAAGHFLVGFALRLDAEEGQRHLELARLDYRSVGRPELAALSAFTAKAADFTLSDAGSTELFEAALSMLEDASPAAARRLAPAVEHYLAVARLSNSLPDADEIPREFPPPFTDDDLQLLRLAMIRSVRRPARLAEVARWIQSLRGRPKDSTEELDIVVRVLRDARVYDDLVPILRAMVAHGDERLETTMLLASALTETGDWPAAKSLLVERIGERPGPELVRLLEKLAALGRVFDDPEYKGWLETLRLLDPDRARYGPAPPTMVNDALDEPQLFARYEDGTLTLDPRVLGLGERDMGVHIRAATVLGLGPEKGMEFLGDIRRKEPDFYQEVVRLLPPYARPRLPGGAELRRAEDLFAKYKFREAIVEYRAAIELDHDNELAYLGLGDAHYRLGEYHLAIAYFSESIAVRPTPQAHRFLGDAILLSHGDRRRARRCFMDALALDPEYAGAREALGDLSDSWQGEADDDG